MKYIKREPVTATTLTCSHSKVERIWEFGGSSINPTDGTMHHYICLKMKDVDEPITFKDDENGNSEEQADKYLSSIK